MARLQSSSPRSLFRNRPLLRRVIRAAAPFRRELVLLCLLVTAGTALPLVQPILVRNVVDRIIAGGSFGGLVLSIVAFGAAGVASAGALLAADRLGALVGYRLIRDLQLRLFRHLGSMPLEFFTTVRPGAVVSRLTNDVYATEPMFTSVVVAGLANLVTVGGALVVLSIVDIRLALTFAVFPVALIPIRLAESRINQLLRASFSLGARLSSVIEAVLNRDGIVLARQSAQFAREAEGAARIADELADTSIASKVWQASVVATYGVTFTVITTLLLLGGAWLTTRGEASLGTLLLFVLYVRQVQVPLTSLIGLRYPAIRAGIAFERVFDVLDTDLRSERTSSQSVRPAWQPDAPAIRFANVRYAYPAVRDVSIEGLSHVDAAVPVAGFALTTLAATESPGAPRQNVLDGISFEVRTGEVVAVVGESGVGKSTIAMLCAGLATATDGTVEIGGVDAREWTDVDLAPHIAVITQDTYVLHDTLMNNLRYVKPEATQAEVAAACVAARLDRLIASLPQEYETIVGEKGYRLSGGERQRLAIARALLKAPALVILDEPTSQLDARTEAEIKEALSRVFVGRAVIMIAHRLSTVVDASRILVVERGVIAESGTHADLLAAPGGSYASLYRQQLNGATAS